MVTLFEIKKAVNKTLIDNFNISVLKHTVKDEIEYPCFFTTVKSLKLEAITSILDREYVKVRIFYYPPQSKNKEVDMLKMLGELQEIFRITLNCEDRVFTIDDCASDIDLEDYFLTFSFNFKYLKRHKLPDVDKMEDFDIDNIVDKFENMTDFDIDNDDFNLKI